MIIDLHVHTIKGAPDSILTPQEAVAEAKRIGLDGICLTEHGDAWDHDEFREFAARQDILVMNGMELSTDYGHVLVFGVNGKAECRYHVDHIRQAVDEADGFMILAHPFRVSPAVGMLQEISRSEQGLVFQRALMQRLVSLPVFGLVHEIEALNGANGKAENDLALEIARKLGLRGTGGSDSHSSRTLGSAVTVFEGDIENERDLIRELKAGRFSPASGFREGKLVPM